MLVFIRRYASIQTERANAVAVLSVCAMMIFVVPKKMGDRNCSFDYFVTPSCSINLDISATPQCSTPIPFSKRAM
jgi:hypothetical protein